MDVLSEGIAWLLAFFYGLPVVRVARAATLDVVARDFIAAARARGERTGTIIMGSQLMISTVAIAHGNLTIQVKETPEVSQPNPFAPRGAATVVVPRSSVAIKEEKASLSMVGGVSIGDIVQGLNALGVTPRDLISILQAIRQAGALMADIEIM